MLWNDHRSSGMARYMQITRQANSLSFLHNHRKDQHQTLKQHSGFEQTNIQQALSTVIFKKTLQRVANQISGTKIRVPPFRTLAIQSEKRKV
jgi:hypothetical protein